MRRHEEFTASNSRREFLKKSALGAIACGLPFSAFPSYLKNVPMGIVVHSYAARWHSDTPSEKYPGFENALSLIEHCKKIQREFLAIN